MFDNVPPDVTEIDEDEDGNILVLAFTGIDGKGIDTDISCELVLFITLKT